MSIIFVGFDILNGVYGYVDVYDYEYYDIGGNIVFGFWFYFMIDCLLFVLFFVIYVVLFMNIVGGVLGKDIFEFDFVVVEIVVLLFSSIIFGFVMIFVYG